jgi:hypothetical protein
MRCILAVLLFCCFALDAQLGRRPSERDAKLALSHGLIDPPTMPRTLDKSLNPSSKGTTGGRVGQWVYGTPEGVRGLRQSVHHMFTALRVREMVTVLTDPHYIEACAEAGLAFDVIDALQRVVDKLEVVTERRGSKLGAAASFAGSSSVGGMRSGAGAGRGSARLTIPEDPSLLDVVLEAVSPAKSTKSTADEVRTLYFSVPPPPHPPPPTPHPTPFPLMQHHAGTMSYLCPALHVLSCSPLSWSRWSSCARCVASWTLSATRLPSCERTPCVSPCFPSLFFKPRTTNRM